MTQPTTLPSAEAQKAAALEVFAQYEPPLYEAYLEMMLEWLAAVKTAMFAGGVATLGLVPDPMTVFSQTPKWAALVAEYSADVAREALAAPYRQLFADGDVFESRPFVRNWISQRENRLNRFPDEVFGLVRHVIDSATTNGASIPDVTVQVEELFTATGEKNWKGRARTVARTEVVGAYNGGLYDAFRMIVENDPGTTWVKRWLATEDHRTRPDHVEADGQTVPFDQPFILGAREGDEPFPGYAMMYPHDPDGPAHEIINCRCVMLLEEAGQPTDMGNRGYTTLAALTAAFNPAEKRDKHGKWTKGGGGLLKKLMKSGKGDKNTVSEAGPAPWLDKPTPFPTGPISTPPSAPRPSVGTTGGRKKREEKIIGLPEDWDRENPDPRYDKAVNGAQALAQFPEMDKLPSAQMNTLVWYTGEAFEDLNSALSKTPLGEDPSYRLDSVQKRGLKVLDETLKTNPRTSDVILWRGMRRGHQKFGDAYAGDLTGVEWTQKGFNSTSADYGVAAGFAGQDEGAVIMRVLLPKEAKVGGVNANGKSNINAHEREVLLPRNVRYRVTKDHGMSKGGGRVLDVEVVS